MSLPRDAGAMHTGGLRGGEWALQGVGGDIIEGAGVGLAIRESRAA